jgi:hypothetical protein
MSSAPGTRKERRRTNPANPAEVAVSPVSVSVRDCARDRSRRRVPRPSSRSLSRPLLPGREGPQSSDRDADPISRLAINFRTAKALGLAVPPRLLSTAPTRSSNRARQFPARVILDRIGLSASCPVYARSRPWSGRLRSAASCQFRTHAPQQSEPYSITSSVRTSTLAGISRPSAFAALRLITS